MIAQHGRYTLFAAGVPCGSEAWRVESRGEHGSEASGLQETRAPHPFPSRTAWRAMLSPLQRVTSLEVDWHVGERHLRAVHRAAGDLWQVRVEHGGHTREQEGDYPAFCEVLFGSHVFHTLALGRYVWAEGAEHVFPALLIGPPWMAVEPGRQRIVCTGEASRVTPLGEIRCRRLEVHDLTSSATPYVMWVDHDDRVIESFEDLEGRQPWMRLEEWDVLRRSDSDPAGPL